MTTTITQSGNLTVIFDDDLPNGTYLVGGNSQNRTHVGDLYVRKGITYGQLLVDLNRQLELYTADLNNMAKVTGRCVNLMYKGCRVQGDDLAHEGPHNCRLEVKVTRTCICVVQ